jgi:hypothetical protein
MVLRRETEIALATDGQSCAWDAAINAPLKMSAMKALAMPTTCRAMVAVPLASTFDTGIVGWIAARDQGQRNKGISSVFRERPTPTL